MSVALRGNIHDFGIADVFQLIGQQRKTGVLEFSGETGRIQLHIDRGVVVSAAPVGSWHDAALGDMLLRCGRLTPERVAGLRGECEASAQRLVRVAVERGWLTEEEVIEVEDLLTRETIFEVLQWSGGSFDFTAQPVVRERPLEDLLGAEQILMDGLRMVDEWQSFAELVPSEDAVFQRASTLDEFRRRASGEAQRRFAAAERVFALIDGRVTVRRIVDLSLLGTFEAVRALATLHRLRIIEPAADAGPARPRTRRKRRDATSSASPMAVLVSLLPLLLLAAVVLLPAWGTTERAGEAEFAIRRAPLEEARAVSRARRVRHALETYRYQTGNWPNDLADLERLQLLPSPALASREGRPYYYAADREKGALLLAPER